MPNHGFQCTAALIKSPNLNAYSCVMPHTLQSGLTISSCGNTCGFNKQRKISVAATNQSHISSW